MMEIILYILRIILFLCFIHFVLYYNNIDIFDIIQKNKQMKENKQENIDVKNLALNENVNIEDNIKELQHTLKELESL